MDERLKQLQKKWDNNPRSLSPEEGREFVRLLRSESASSGRRLAAEKRGRKSSPAALTEEQIKQLMAIQ